MEDYILAVANKDIMDMAKRAFDLVNSKLIGHGERVAHIMYRLLKETGSFSPLEIRNLLILSVLHDIGAYKMEEIDRMLAFDTKNVRNHSIYGYLFFHSFTFLSKTAPVVLFHHSHWSALRQMKDIPGPIRQAAQLLHLADRVDIYIQNPRYKNGNQELIEKLKDAGDEVFSPEIINLASGMDFFLTEEAWKKENREFGMAMEAVPLTEQEKESVLKMLIYALISEALIQ